MSNDRLLQTFLDLVRIDSPTGEEAGIAQYCAERLRTLGFEVHIDATADVTGSDTGNLLAVLNGTGARAVVLSAHMDCVEPCRGVEPVLVDGVVSSSGGTVLGADDKAGIAAILEAVTRAVESGVSRPTMQVVLTVQEEIGLRGAKALDPTELVRADLCLVLDADGPPGGIIVASPTHYTFIATITGRAAHAGVAPERGVSAIALAARAVASMPVGRLDEATTANVGTIHGGSATNVIAPLVTMTGECRSLDRSRVESLRAQMDATIRTVVEDGGGEVEIAWTREYEGFALSASDHPVEFVANACGDVGLEVSMQRTGGGSDANILAALGIPTVALSCGMRSVHSTEESIAVEDLEALTRHTHAVLVRLAD